MEKLQAAIEKAREQRKTTTKAGATERATRGTATPANWDALEMISTRASAMMKKRVFEDTQSQEASYFDLLRTKILQQCREHGWRRVVVTSPTKACGKTTICANLAASFSRQTDRRMMLIDLDMRRPELSKVFGHRAEHSFSDVLSQKVAFADQAVRLSENVAISMNQTPAPNPSKLILQDSTGGIIDQIEREYAPDIMIFDTPPVLVTDDTLAFLKHADCALIVAAAETTTTDQIDKCEKEVAENANVMGVVLNKCLYNDEAYGYDYKY
ncbi:MAG: CpsD/CapB family tyrosine-protein kinase [Alphaproteobacteria bacterium]|nr:CpsD/CapB family tyrosine-protein kinase [Alphaproteobacteria bacterium]